jgi:hypothetical protein
MVSAAYVVTSRPYPCPSQRLRWRMLPHLQLLREERRLRAPAEQHSLVVLLCCSVAVLLWCCDVVMVWCCGVMALLWFGAMASAHPHSQPTNKMWCPQPHPLRCRPVGCPLNEGLCPESGARPAAGRERGGSRRSGAASAKRTHGGAVRLHGAPPSRPKVTFVVPIVSS